MEAATMSETQPSPASTQRVDVDPNDALNERWKWGSSVTSFVADRLEGRSLKVCTGLSPVCDVNLDILPLPDVINEYNDADYTIDPVTHEVEPDAGAHAAFGGRFVQGDMLDLPFDDQSFETVVSDPPWRGKSEADRRRMFAECLRVCTIGGKLIYNATWLPEHARARLRDTRVRQEKDFWGCPSFLVFYRRTPDEYELLDYYEYEVDSHARALVMAKYVDADRITNPRAVDPNEGEYHCPKCGSTRLGQLDEVTNPHDIYEFDLYECMNPRCGFRVSEDELEQQADHIATAGVESWTEWQAFLAARGFTDWRDAIDRGGDRFLTTTSHHPNRDFSGSAAEREANRATPHS